MRAMGFFLVGFMAVAAVGCGGGDDGVKVSGQVVKNGAPYTLADGEAITINLTSADGKTTCTTSAQNDGAFSVQKPSGGPVPAGKYKVSYTFNQSSAPGAKKTFTKTVTKNADDWDISPTNASFTTDIGKN
ncbi:MAG TPA: hypothetical protein VH092_38630 [Urbifossiella sp.]|jgi:hypothetical protein|nr:hypothetical protein [Urbifossiella sp.]